MTSSLTTISFEIRNDRVALVTLDRPEVLNSFNTVMADELLEVAERLGSTPEVGVAVIAGAGGKAFCAGADIAEFGVLDTPDQFHGFLTRLSAAVEAIAALPQIVIAAVEGVAFGGGCELAMACDLRTVSRRTRFGLPEVKLGLLPGLGGTQRAVRSLPYSVALRLLVTGDPLDAESAHRLGFCEAPVDEGGALAAAVELAGRLAVGPGEAIRAAKALLREGGGLALPEAIALEQQVGRDLFGTDDAREGVAAFLEKRVAVFGLGSSAPTHSAGHTVREC